MKRDESFSPSLFTFRLHFAVIRHNYYYVFVTARRRSIAPGTTCFARMRTPSKLLISCLRFLLFPTNWGICFSFKANSKGLNLTHKCTFRAR